VGKDYIVVDNNQNHEADDLTSPGIMSMRQASEVLSPTLTDRHKTNENSTIMSRLSCQPVESKMSKQLNQRKEHATGYMRMSK
jgi:hypothetical protein